MEWIAHESHGFDEAEAWDIKQHTAMTPWERMAAVRELRRRAYPIDAEDIRACHRNG